MCIISADIADVGPYTKASLQRCLGYVNTRGGSETNLVNVFQQNRLPSQKLKTETQEVIFMQCFGQVYMIHYICHRLHVHIPVVHVCTEQ